MILPQLDTALKSSTFRIAVTGASGWIGRALLDMLHEVLGDEAFAQRVVAFGSFAYDMPLSGGAVVQVHPLSELPAQPAGQWLLAHMAFRTKDKVSEQGFDAFVADNKLISDTVEKAIKTLKPLHILYPSSGAVYAADGTLCQDMAANPYGVMKVADEQRFMALASEVGARMVVPRVFNIGGAGINKWSAYALSDIIVKVQSGVPVVINAKHAVVRSYVHVKDLLQLCLLVLLDTAQPTPLVFDTQGQEDVEIETLAKKVADVIANGHYPIQREADFSLPENRYVGDGSTMRALMKHYDMVPMSLEQQILETAEDIAARKVAS